MVRIYICEDNPNHLKEINRQVGYYCSFSDWNMKVVSATRHPEKLIQQLVVDEEINIYLLDLEYSMTNGMSGFELGKKIRKRDPLGYIIYLTSHIEMSYLTFQYKVNAIDFIIKDGPDDWKKRLTDCLKTIESQLETMKRNKQKDIIELNVGYGMMSFFLDEILFFEAAVAHKIYVYTEKKTITAMKITLNEIEMMLATKFIRCHRSFLINREKVAAIEKNYSELILTNQMKIPISTRKKKEVRQQFPQK
ncbi:response regulator transcription factor [Enterococcus sp. BWM-S5]|uniref:Response regulator transcription factor n=1 Tax=Enterococcus larvae TaxID=2794352 RepID=A0ABS4CIT1_9ENTE|nr:LytTR family DNA-binding domain-containing protein [Enterococcus larvae]MBP1046531.1 response regulator transcription factor [Enterococcus larvae]